MNDSMMFKERSFHSKSAAPAPAASAIASLSKAPSPNAPAPPCSAMILDMGEGSREEGFRLNGCR